MDEVAYIINHSDAAFLVGEGQEEVDKALSIQEKCPFLKKIIWDDPKGMRDYNDPVLISLKEVMEKGRELDQKDPGLFEKMFPRERPEMWPCSFIPPGPRPCPKGPSFPIITC